MYVCWLHVCVYLYVCRVANAHMHPLHVYLPKNSGSKILKLDIYLRAKISHTNIHTHVLYSCCMISHTLKGSSLTIPFRRISRKTCTAWYVQLCFNVCYPHFTREGSTLNSSRVTWFSLLFWCTLHPRAGFGTHDSVHVVGVMWVPRTRNISVSSLR